MTHPRPLGVVMPVFNEGDWPARSLAALREAATAAGLPLAVVIVDDGSDPASARKLDGLVAPDVRVLHQPNQGRFAARLAGLKAAETDLVLLLDARVLLASDALLALRDELSRAPGETLTGVLNAHVDTVVEGNPWAAFWSGITKLWWRRYWAEPRRTTFGVNDFDAYPKGTSALLGRRELLLRTAGGFISLFADQRFASDDTRWLRAVAEQECITIDPAFRCTYHGKDSARKWAAQARFRGTTFVDGYLDSRRAAGYILAGLGVGALALGTAAARHPRGTVRAAVGSLGVGAITGARAARRAGAVPAEVRSMVCLAPAFGVLFGAGVLRGLAMALRSRRE